MHTKELGYTVIVTISLSFITCDNAYASKKSGKQADSDMLAAVYRCMNILKPKKRLDCYDREIKHLDNAIKDRKIIIYDTNKIEQLRKEAFGFKLPSLPKIGGKDTRRAMVENVRTIRKSGKGFIVILENGQVWKITNTDMKRPPKGKLTATITPKSLGSYMIALDNGKRRTGGHRVRRVK